MIGLFGASFDFPEFIFGLLLGMLMLIPLRYAATIMAYLKEWAREIWRITQRSLTASAAEPYQQELIHFLQRLHLADPLFPLKEILVTPQLLIPKPWTKPGSEGAIEIDCKILPPLPDAPNWASIYRTPRFPCDYLLRLGTNAVILGEPGAGKTTALAHIALSCFRPLEEDEPPLPLPIYVHAADLVAEGVAEDPYPALLRAAVRLYPLRLSRTLPRYLQAALDRAKVVLLVDGLDELNPAEMRHLVTFLMLFVNDHPQHQVIAAAAPQHIDGLTRAGLVPLALAPWGSFERQRFLEAWAAAWQRHVKPRMAQDALDAVDPALINAWLTNALEATWPFDLTLGVWGAYLGDVASMKPAHCVEAYLARILGEGEREFAHALAVRWIESRAAAIAHDRAGPTGDLLKAGLLTRRAGNRVAFLYPRMGIMLAAAKGASPSELGLKPADPWPPARAALKYLAAAGKIPAIPAKAFEADDPGRDFLLQVSSWLAEVPPEVPWRIQALTSLGRIVHDPWQPYGLRLRALYALLSGDKEGSTRFATNLLSSTDESSKTLGALAAGALADDHFTAKLAELAVAQVPGHVRYAIYLALARIGSEKCRQLLAQVLMEGAEEWQLLCALALAQAPGWGYQTLVQAAAKGNVSARRAAMYGLGRVPMKGAERILEKARRDDDQWVVKNAADQALESRHHTQLRLEPPAPQPEALDWLIEIAAKIGLGIAPGKGALEMLRRVLNEGSPQHKVAALEAIGWFGLSELRVEVVNALRDEQDQVRQAAYECYRWLVAMGQRIAERTQPAAPAKPSRPKS